ncbi:hypothetical protein [Streptomyces sp. NBC_00280]
MKAFRTTTASLVLVCAGLKKSCGPTWALDGVGVSVPAGGSPPRVLA